ncbi:hypothetical protein TRICI_005865 [Trichomonascus ciferrii]|uniref:Uncharacterized protein n=1 Tax=Trichomonascus ciferrii TaxID=44093 RepID=A0A642UNX8_9ASCO|nr:hypothetical protein TRICI_005865 [Trichomonascus ciferrii]
MVTEDGKSDYFYLCEGHLADTAFATPQVDPEVEKAKERQKALGKEIKELERRWKEHEAKKKKDKGDKENENEDEKKASEKSALKAEQEKNDAVANKKPRIYLLNKDIFSIRISNWKDAQRSKKTSQLLSKPNLFPKVPTHDPASTPSPSTDNTDNSEK